MEKITRKRLADAAAVFCAAAGITFGQLNPRGSNGLAAVA